MEFEDKRAFIGLFFGESKVIVHGVKEFGLGFARVVINDDQLRI